MTIKKNVPMYRNTTQMISRLSNCGLSIPFIHVEDTKTVILAPMPPSIAAVKTIPKDKNPNIYVVARATGAMLWISDMVARIMDTRNVA